MQAKTRKEATLLRQNLPTIIIPLEEIQPHIFPLKILQIVMQNFLLIRLFNSQDGKITISLNILPLIMTFNKSKHRNLMVSDSRTGKEKSRINS
jgi:hypothetical protein